MIKNKITLMTISLLFFIAFFGTVFFVYNKPHKDFSSAQADITIDATKLYEHYQDDLSNANLKFLDKVLLVNGPVTEINSNLVIIKGNIICSLDSSHFLDTSIKLYDEISVRGRCIGYDDLFGEVRIDHCFIMQN